MATVFLLLTCSVLHRISADIVNVALNRPASMSSYFGDGALQAGGAVDGNTSSSWPSIMATAVNQPSAWWRVDLEREVQDVTVRIYFRTDYTWRRNGVKLYTSTSPFPESNPTSQGQLCDTVTGDPSGSDIPDVYNVTCPGRWRYLLLYTDTDNVNEGYGPVLDFGEVQVLGQPPCANNSHYGLNCDKSCSDRKCKAPSTSSCDRLTGRCPDGCETGWRQEDCTQACGSSYYGPSCTLRCTDRQCLNASSPCDHVTGQCLGGCRAGYIERDCTLHKNTPNRSSSLAGIVLERLLGTVFLAVLTVVGIFPDCRL